MVVLECISMFYTIYFVLFLYSNKNLIVFRIRFACLHLRVILSHFMFILLVLVTYCVYIILCLHFIEKTP